MSKLNPAPKTILFSGHDFKFIRPFVSHCEKSALYRVLIDEHPGHELTDPQKSLNLLDSADIIFCEWCLGNAVWYSQHKLPRQTLLIRLHMQEMRLPYLDRVRWDNVDALILICPLNQLRIHARFPFLRDKTRLIYNPINCPRLNQPKLPGAEFNLGILGICPRLKAPHLALEILEKLKQQDRRYTLFVKGKHPRNYDWLWQRPTERAYYEKFFADLERSPFANSILLEPYGDDVPLWFSKIGFLLSTSEFEGSHQSVAEGMASGAIPIIRDWPGAELLYPSKFLARTVEEFAQAAFNGRVSGHYLEETEFCRAYAQKHFDQQVVCPALERLFGNGRPDPNLVMVADHPPPLSPSGSVKLMILAYLPVGIESGYRIRVEQEIMVLTKKGVTVHLVCLVPETTPPAALAIHRTELEALGGTVHLVPVARFFDLQLNDSVISGVLDTLQQIATSNDLCILHAEALYCARVGLLLKQRIPNLRLSFDCHGASPEEERLSGAHPSRISVMKDWERRVLLNADLAVFVSQAMLDYYRQEYGLMEMRQAIVPCCVTEERFAGGPAPAALARLPQDRPVLAYLGSLAPWQCGEEMMRLFAQLHHHNPQLFFLLLMPQANHKRARNLMTQHRLPQSHARLVELPHHQIPSALQLAHVGVLLRRAHPVNTVSSPTKFGEYLAAGVPVLMTEGIGDVSRMALENGVGLVLETGGLEQASWPTETLSRIIDFINQTRLKRKKVARRCRSLAREKLHWDAAATTLINEYRALIRVPSAKTIVPTQSVTRIW